MIRRGKILAWLVIVLAIAIVQQGCGVGNAQTTAEEWLRQSYTGLQSQPEYSFTGSTSMGMDDGLMFQPLTFEGSVVKNEQVTIQSKQIHSLTWHPNELLESLNEEHLKATITATDIDNELHRTTITLQVEEDPSVSKQRWEIGLINQLEQIEEDKRQEYIAIKSAEEIQIIEEAHRELEAMLQTLVVTSRYDIVMDRNKKLPIKMIENTKFNYERHGRQVNEFRQTTVHFQNFQ